VCAACSLGASKLSMIQAACVAHPITGQLASQHRQNCSRTAIPSALQIPGNDTKQHAAMHVPDILAPEVTPTSVYKNAASLRTDGMATLSGFLMPTCDQHAACAMQPHTEPW
jgi:hypothetical protein